MFAPFSSEAVPCGVCGEPEARFAFSKRGFDIWRCLSCGFLFVHPLPEEDPALIYSEGYFSGAKAGFGYLNYDEDKAAMRPFFERVLETMESFLPGRGRLLDVGAATGFFAKLARERGWETRAVEISEYAAGEARKSGLDVVCGTLESARLPSSSFEAVVLLDVLEHVGSPAATVKECSRILKPRGILFINTPDAGSLWARIFGKRWHAYCPPEHLSYFNKKNLRLLLEKNSFRIERAGKMAKKFTPAYVASILHRWQKLAPWKWMAERLEGSSINRAAIPLNIRDNFFMIARKSETAVPTERPPVE